MRTATIITAWALLLAAGAAWADGVPANTSPSSYSDPPLEAPRGNMTTLASPTMEREIQAVLDKANAEESRLLAALVAATDEVECQRVIARLEALDLERDLAILRIQARCARNRGLWDLERRIRERIEELLDGRMVANR